MKTRKKIALQIGGHFSTAPRPQKEAATLTEAGYEVTVFGTWYDSQRAQEDRELAEAAGCAFVPVVDVRAGVASRQTRFMARLTRRIALEVFRRTGRYSPRLVGYQPDQYEKALLRYRADLYIVHSELGLWLAGRLARRGAKVAVDFEDWFSEDLSEADRRDRPVQAMKQQEQWLLRNAAFAEVTSRAMGEAYREAYEVRAPLVVNYNAFPRSAGPEVLPLRNPGEAVSVHWYSQTIGPGRGLETLFAALRHCQSRFRIRLRGALSESRRQLFLAMIPEEWRGQVEFLEPVPNRELVAAIARHDIGLALEQREPLSRDVTVTNKLFHYLLGGLAVVATATRGQSEVMQGASEVGCLIEPGDPLALAEALDSLVLDRGRLQFCRERALAAARQKFCWEEQVPVLLEAVAAALNGSSLAGSQADGPQAAGSLSSFTRPAG